MAKRPLEICLFGACIVRGANGADFTISGVKKRALFALLATAPAGQRTRAFLQELLWGTICYDSGRQSLRRALSDIRKAMGPHFNELIAVTNTDISLDLSKVCFIGEPGTSQFLEGMEIREEGFQRWLNGMRQTPEQLYSLYNGAAAANKSRILPYVTVIPFRTYADQTIHPLMGDWMAEEICRSLSRSNLLNVISHLSSRSMAASQLDLDQIRASLDVDYCVSGTLRAIGDQLLVDADFIDTRSGIILWTRKFSGSVDHFMGEAAEGLNMIVNNVGRSIADEAVNYVKDRPLPVLEDHQLLVAGASLMHQPTLKAFARSRELIKEALQRAPRSAESHAWLGKWHVLSVFNGWSTDKERDTGLASDCTARALDLDPHNAFCLSIDGFVNNNLLQELDIAEQRYEAALQINPSESLSWLLRGALHAFRDQSSKAVAAADKARRLSPVDPFGYYYDSLSSTAYLSAGDYEKALDFADQSLARNDRHLSTLRAKITALHKLDRQDEARQAAQDLLRRVPDFTVSSYLRAHPSSNYELGQTVANALETAGIP